jgi:hypothetical protein
MADNTDDAPAAAKKERRQIQKGLETAPRLYSNNVMLTGSPWDLRMIFGQIEEADADHLTIAHEIVVYMSPAHAKLFAALLTKKIADYEEKFPTWRVGQIEVAIEDEKAKA